jgi:DNA-binding NtrC family response regulator
VKVLVVDPAPDSRDALRQAISGAGGQFRGVTSLAEARRHLSEFAPDVVVAALDLPDGDPDAFLAELSREVPRRAAWVLAPAAEALDAAVRAVSRGADDFLWRPVSAERVSTLLRTLRDRRQSEASAEEIRLKLARLEALVVHLPPLRERGDDVVRLARQFLEETSTTLAFDSEAMEALAAHDWPANVQELREAVRRAAELAEGPTIGPIVVRSVLGRPLAARGSRRRKVPVVRITVGDSLADVERRLIQKTLEFAKGNKKKTAELLKLSLKTIYNKIKEYGLEH